MHFPSTCYDITILSVYKSHIFYGDSSRTVALRHMECSKRAWAYLQVLFQLLFCLTKVLNMAMVQKFEVVFGQTLNYSV
jgi:hypothetical protein